MNNKFVWYSLEFGEKAISLYLKLTELTDLPSYTQMAFLLCANVNGPSNERFFHKPVKNEKIPHSKIKLFYVSNIIPPTE